MWQVGIIKHPESNDVHLRKTATDDDDIKHFLRDGFLDVKTSVTIVARAVTESGTEMMMVQHRSANGKFICGWLKAAYVDVEQ